MGRREAQWKGFAAGGAAAMVAGTTTHPLDLIKVRMQLQAETCLPRNPSFAMEAVRSTAFSTAVASSPPSLSPLSPMRPGPISVAMSVVRREGAAGLFSGVSATILRQGLYSSTRMGIYEVLKQAWEDPREGGGGPKALPLYKKVTAGLLSGAIGAAVGNPADLAMVRMQADGRLPLQNQRNYRHVGDAIRRIASEEGVEVLWRGCGPTVQRAMVVTASQLATYDQAKESLLRGGLSEGPSLHVAASFAAGLVASVTSCPLDVVKTQLMDMAVEEGRAAPYKGTWDCAVKMVQAEGFMALYKGFVPTVARQGPFTMVLFVTLEQVRSLLARL